MMREKRDEDLFKGSTMTFGEHLEELRTCLWRSVFGIILGFLVGLYCAQSVIAWIQKPLEDALENYRTTQAQTKVQKRIDEYVANGYPADMAQVVVTSHLIPKKYLIFPHELAEKAGLKLAAAEDAALGKDGTSKEVAGAAGGQKADPGSEAAALKLVEITLWQPVKESEGVKSTSLSVHEPFTMYIKAALIVGLILSSPWVFYQIWSFVAAGLYPHEKKYVHVFLPVSLGLFIFGAAVVFLFVFKPVLDFLFMFNAAMNIDPDPRIEYWLSFVLILPIGFGVSFQLPLVMLFLERIGIFTVHTYISSWRPAIMVIFVIAAILTPPDPTSMMCMAAPLCFLYVSGILLCKFMPKTRSPYDELDAAS